VQSIATALGCCNRLFNLNHYEYATVGYPLASIEPERSDCAAATRTGANQATLWTPSPRIALHAFRLAALKIKMSRPF
jgi:hypothetical protein